MCTTLLTDIDTGIATLTLNRPEKHNALNEALTTAIIQQLHEIEQNPEIRVLILQANGKNFCAGADLNWLMDKANNAPQLLAELMQTLQQFNKPTIALVQGNVYGGGLGLVACCDIALGAMSANFCFSEVKLGLIPAIIAPYCIAAMGPRAAQYYFLTAQAFNADEAWRLGLIQQKVRQQDLQCTGQTLAKTLLANSPQALHAVKRLIPDVCQLPSREFAKKTAEWLMAQQRTSDALEGCKAFNEKRRPIWSAEFKD